MGASALTDILLYYNDASSKGGSRGEAMRRRVGSLALVSGLVTAVAPAAAQTPPHPLPPFADPALGITVTATRLDQPPSSIHPRLAATVYAFTNPPIHNVPPRYPPPPH